MIKALLVIMALVVLGLVVWVVKKVFKGPEDEDEDHYGRYR